MPVALLITPGKGRLTLAIHRGDSRIWNGRLFADDPRHQPRLRRRNQLVGRAVLAVVRPLEGEAALDEHAVHFLHVEGVADVGDGLLVVKVLAREDIHGEVVELGEGMEGDVALGDDDEAGDAGVGGVGGLVLEHVRAADFGHANGGGVSVQDLLDEHPVAELAGVTTGTIDDQVGPNTRETPYKRPCEVASCFRSGNSRYTSSDTFRQARHAPDLAWPDSACAG